MTTRVLDAERCHRKPTGSARALWRLPALVASVALSAGCQKKPDAPPTPPLETRAASEGPATPPAPEAPPPAAGTVAIAPNTPEAVAALAKALVGSADAAGAAKAIVTGLAARTSLLPAEQPLGRDPLAPPDAAAAVAKGPTALTGIECGSLAAALLRAVGQAPKTTLVFPDGGGRTSFRLRAIAVDVGGPVVPCGLAITADTPGEALDADGEGAQFLGLSALRLAERQELDKATSQLAEAQKVAPKDAAVAFLGGQLQAIRGDVDAGMEAMEKAVADAEDADGQYQLAVAYLRVDERFSAFKALERAIKLSPKHIRALAALASLHIERRQELPEDQHATVDAELDRLEAALAAVGPDTPGLAELRVQRLRLAGKADEAEKAALAAVATAPRAPLFMLLADMAKARGDDGAAEKHLEAAGKADPLDAEPLVQLAQLQANRGDIDKTIATLGDATRRAPHDPDLLANYANVLLQVGRTDEASKVATDLKNRFPETAEGYALLAQIALQGGNIAGANELLEQALAKNAKATDLYVMLYIGYVMGGTPEKAAGVLDRLLKVEPEGRMMIAQALLQTGQVEGAAGLLEKELEASPGRIEVAITLAQIYTLGQKADAVERLRKGVEARGNADELKAFDEALVEIKKRAEEAEKAELPGGLPMVDPGAAAPEAADPGAAAP